jgi:hypothetical protein
MNGAWDGPEGVSWIVVSEKELGERDSSGDGRGEPAWLGLWLWLWSFEVALCVRAIMAVRVKSIDNVKFKLKIPV